MNGNKKMELLGSAPISKALLAMGIPTMLGMMVNALYNLVDAYFVGGLGTSQMGAISVVYPLGQVVVGLGLLFGNGAASYISRLLGNGNKDTANKVANTALFSSIAVGAVMIFFSVIFLTPILNLLGATESILPYAKTYATIYIISCIFNVFNVTMNNIVTSEGAAKTTMCALMSGAVLNIALDPICIYVLHWGVAGAAIATAISQVVSTMIYLIYLLRKKSVFHFNIKECCYSKEIMSEIFKIGIPTLVFQLLTSLSISLINTQAKVYGDSVIAGMGAVTRLISMGSLMVFGFIKGFQPIAGYSYGAKKIDRLCKAIKVSILWSTAFCLIYGIVIALCAAPIISGFTSDDMKMIQVGETALRANGLSFILFGFYTVYSSLFLALGKGKEGFFLGACRQGICFIPIILILPLLFGINGILYAQPVSDVLSAVITIFMALKLHRELFSSGFGNSILTVHHNQDNSENVVDQLKQS
ncbi:MAG: MATE family efflux transporter [bacterium]|nr:MATE family efflux transporter [bacterium]